MLELVLFFVYLFGSSGFIALFFFCQDIPQIQFYYWLKFLNSLNGVIV